MLKRMGFGLVRKTERRMHRCRGSGEVYIEHKLLGGISKFKVYGNATVSDAGSFAGVPQDYYSGSGDTLRLGKSNLNLYSCSNILEQIFITSDGDVQKEADGYLLNPQFYSYTPIYLSLKEGVRYTFFMRMKFYSHAAGHLQSPLEIYYSDGTSERPSYQREGAEGYLHYVTRADSQISHIMLPSVTEATKILSDGFGIVQGVKDEDYYPRPPFFETESIRFTYPLLSLGSKYDELDLISGEGIRKINRVTFDKSSDFTLTADGYFSLPLPKRATGDIALSSRGIRYLSASEHAEKKVGMRLSESGDALLLTVKAGQSDPSELLDYLNPSPLEVIYVMEEYEYYAQTEKLHTEDKHEKFSVTAGIEPSKMILEYW